jgi:phage terminase small subunit
MALSKNKHYRLTEKHKLFGKLLPKAESATDAYMKAYPGTTIESARSSACRLLKERPEIIEYARDTANRNGLSIDKATKTLASKLTAKKVITLGNGDYIETEDHNAQIKASEIALKVHGALKDTDNSVNINVQHNQALILDKLGERMDKVLEMLGYDIGRDAEGRKVIHNLSTSYEQGDAVVPDTVDLERFPRGNAQDNGNENKKAVVDADYSIDAGDSTSGVEVSGQD